MMSTKNMPLNILLKAMVKNQLMTRSISTGRQKMMNSLNWFDGQKELGYSHDINIFQETHFYWAPSHASYKMLS